MKKYDTIVIGAGPSGIMAAITATKNHKKCLLIERNSYIGAKILASGGGRCNLSNTLPTEAFVGMFSREGKFMLTGLKTFGSKELTEFLASIGVKCHAPDGFRIFPVTHNSQTVVNALTQEIQRLNIETLMSHRVTQISKNSETWVIDNAYSCNKLIIATGGFGFMHLGTEGDGYKFAAATGHKITKLFPAMLPIKTKETWVKNCRADTIGKAVVQIDLPKYSNKKAVGDLIFTSTGIRGPVVLDFAREITPLIDEYGEVPLLVNLVGGLNEEEIRAKIKGLPQNKLALPLPEMLSTLVPKELCIELCKIVEIDYSHTIGKIEKVKRDKLIKLLTKAPLTAIGCGGFKEAMVTRGGVSLKDINCKTLESKITPNLYFCGEVLDIDGPCGGYNLQWAFTSGYIAGKN
jgi:predicted Rossmann fold flavoprotein